MRDSDNLDGFFSGILFCAWVSAIVALFLLIGWKIALCILAILILPQLNED